MSMMRARDSRSATSFDFALVDAERRGRKYWLADGLAKIVGGSSSLLFGAFVWLALGMSIRNILIEIILLPAALIGLGMPLMGLFMVFVPAIRNRRVAELLIGLGILAILDGGIGLIRYLRQNMAARA